MLHANLSEFHGKPVEDFDPDKGIQDPSGVAYRLRQYWGVDNQAPSGCLWPWSRRVRQDQEGRVQDQSISGLLDRFLSDPNVRQVEAIVIGYWLEMMDGENSFSIVDALVSGREKLPNLEALFLGDITPEECEISWIQQSDLSPLWSAFPQLKVLRVRGAGGLSLGEMQHANLRHLGIESGGLSRTVVGQVAQAELPSLEHLELWLGAKTYGWDGSIEDLRPFAACERFPKLRYLGLKDSEIQDEIAALLADAPVLDRLEVLDLSMGTLSDEGARALLQSNRLGKLKMLDIRHHYVSPELVEQLEAKGIAVEQQPDDPQEAGDETDRYIAVSE